MLLPLVANSEAISCMLLPLVANAEAISLKRIKRVRIGALAFVLLEQLFLIYWSSFFLIYWSSCLVIFFYYFKTPQTFSGEWGGAREGQAPRTLYMHICIWKAEILTTFYWNINHFIFYWRRNINHLIFY